jgi:hypothetical protein
MCYSLFFVLYSRRNRPAPRISLHFTSQCQALGPCTDCTSSELSSLPLPTLNTTISTGVCTAHTNLPVKHLIALTFRVPAKEATTLTSDSHSAKDVCTRVYQCNESIGELTRRSQSNTSLIRVLAYRKPRALEFCNGAPKNNRKRPPKLLNLNNSPPAQKKIHVRPIRPYQNRIADFHLQCFQKRSQVAAARQYAAMPPEIRSRIWDFVFADLVVRINHCGRYKYQRGTFRHPIDGYSNGHQQISCHTSRACEEQCVTGVVCRRCLSG